MSSSVGIIILNIWVKIIQMFQTTNQYNKLSDGKSFHDFSRSFVTFGIFDDETLHSSESIRQISSAASVVGIGRSSQVRQGFLPDSAPALRTCQDLPGTSTQQHEPRTAYGAGALFDGPHAAWSGVWPAGLQSEL